MKGKKRKLIADIDIVLEKFSGKGGWTFARLPGVKTEKNTPFGWRKVKGFIDSYEIKQYHLMPFGNGELFLPVKAEIRKKIKKEAGEIVHVVIYEDNSPLETPQEFLICLKEDKKAFNFYNCLSDTEKKKYLDWIYSVKSEEAKVEKMAKAINNLALNKKYYRE
ncbi:MAG: DUF1905 domain-containing protein [Cytophagaceae bacterium]